MSQQSTVNLTADRLKSKGTVFRLLGVTIIVFAMMAGPGRSTARCDVTSPPQAAFVLPGNEAESPVELRWVGGWVLARMKINGTDAGWFKIATGWGGSCIDRKVAANLHLRVISPIGLLLKAGTGTGDARQDWFRADTLECGGARAEAVWLGGKDLAALSESAVDGYGEGISGVIGWDLLRTLPFRLDEAALQLTWLRQATPDAGAVREALIGPTSPVVELVVGEGVRARAVLNTAAAGINFQIPFLRRNIETVWQGRVSGSTRVFYTDPSEDDQLPTGQIVRGWPSGRWVKVALGGRTQIAQATPDTSDLADSGDIQVGYGVLCQWRLLFDGPGSALWLSPATSVPEVEMVRHGRPPLSTKLRASVLRSAVDRNDAGAVRAVAAAGALLNGEGPEDQSPLTRACYSGAREAALALLDAGASIDPFRGKLLSSTPLIAATVGDPEFVKTLLERGADANRTTKTGFLPLNSGARFGGAAAVRALRAKVKLPSADSDVVEFLYNACAGGNLALAKEQMARIGAKVRLNAGWKGSLAGCLEQALLLGHEDVVDWLLQDGGADAAGPGAELAPLLAAIVPTRVEKSDAVRRRLVVRLLAAKANPNASRKGVTPLLLAARHGDAIIVNALLAAGAEAGASDFKGRNALQRAAAANQPAELIAPLLAAGIDRETIDLDTGRAPLGDYAWHGNAAACEALLIAGAKPDAKATFGLTALTLASNSPRSPDDGALAVISILLKHGARVDAPSTDPADTGTLFGAIGGCRSQLVEPLVRAGAPVNGDLKHKLTPLAMAAATSSTATVSRLLDLGADFRAVDDFGVCVLGHAAAAGRVDTMALLLMKGASPNAEGPNGTPPIWVAAASGQLAGARILLRAGADPGARDPKSNTAALEVAKARGDTAMVALLENPPRDQ